MATTTTSLGCYPLQLPPPEADDRLNLTCRTGCALTLYHLVVIVHGGLSIGLELVDVTIQEIVLMFAARTDVSNLPKKLIEEYLSLEFFHVNLLERQWLRVVPDGVKPPPRLFHEITAINNCAYIFGGLVLENGTLVPANDLWRFDLESLTWTCLLDGSDWKTNPLTPAPRYCQKMTPISSLTFVGKSDHYGIFIAGGKDGHLMPLYDNHLFDLVEGKYVGDATLYLRLSPGSHHHNNAGLEHALLKDDKGDINIDYTTSVIVGVDEDEFISQTPLVVPETGPALASVSSLKHTHHKHPLIAVYTPLKVPAPDENLILPLFNFNLGKHIHHGKPLPLHNRRNSAKRGKLGQTPVPYNLRFPTGGLFGHNLVIIGFLPGDIDISVFIYNRPTGRWLRLNVYCNHEYGLHRFWGGFAWQSHHKVVLIGNQITLHTTLAVRFFTQMLTISLPVTNILASLEMAQHQDFPKVMAGLADVKGSSELDSILDSESTCLLLCSSLDLRDLDHSPGIPHLRNSLVSNPGPISFSEYAHYVAPKSSFGKIRLVFPPAAVTLGRNAFDRYGDMVSDFEIVLCQGDRVPVSIQVLTERWGRFFTNILAHGYVTAVDRFELDRNLEIHQGELRLRSLKMSLTLSQKTSVSVLDDGEKPDRSLHLTIPQPKMSKDAPQFRLPFQDSPLAISVTTSDENQGPTSRRDSQTSIQSGHLLLLTSHLQDIPPQLPQPQEPLPAVPATPTLFRSLSRKNLAADGYNSPRGSLLHTLTALRNIPALKSPRESPFALPRALISLQSGPFAAPIELLLLSPVPNLKPMLPAVHQRSHLIDGSDLSRKWSANFDSEDLELSLVPPQDHELKDAFPLLLLFDAANDFDMEALLVPRKLYLPFLLALIKLFCEYLYTGQVGNKWPFWPVAMDVLCIARFYKVPLLYDLVLEVLFAVIGHKEHWILREGRKLKRRYEKLVSQVGQTGPPVAFPLDHYEGLMDTVDDGFLDISLLKKHSRVNRILRRKHSALSEDNQSDNSDAEASDAEDFGLLYLLTNDFAHQMLHPRSKLVFDHLAVALGIGGEGLGQTLELLVNPDTGVPSDGVLDIIYEILVIVMDMKLLMRSKNCQDMTRILRETQEMVEPEIQRLKTLVPERPAPPARQQLEVLMTSQVLEPVLVPEDTEMRPSASTTSLFHLGKKLLEPSLTRPSKRIGPFMFKTRTTTSGGSSQVKPEQMSRAGTTNNVLDVELVTLAQTQTLKIQGMFHLGGPRKKTDSDLFHLGGSRKKTDSDLFHLGGSRKKTDSDMARTTSHSGSVLLSGKEKKKGLFGLKKS